MKTITQNLSKFLFITLFSFGTILCEESESPTIEQPFIPTNFVIPKPQPKSMPQSSMKTAAGNFAIAFLGTYVVLAVPMSVLIGGSSAAILNEKVAYLIALKNWQKAIIVGASSTVASVPGLLLFETEPAGILGVATALGSFASLVYLAIKYLK